MPALLEPETERPNARKVDGVQATGQPRIGGYGPPVIPPQAPESGSEVGRRESQEELNPLTPDAQRYSGGTDLFPNSPEKALSRKAPGQNPANGNKPQSALEKGKAELLDKGLDAALTSVVPGGASLVALKNSKGPLGSAIRSVTDRFTGKKKSDKDKKEAAPLAYFIIGATAIGGVIGLVIFVIAYLNHNYGDNPAGSTAVALSGTQLFASCPNISPTVQVTGAGGKAVTLRLTSDIGTFSDERDWRDETAAANGGALSLSSSAKVQALLKQYPGYYASARWPYAAQSYGGGGVSAKSVLTDPSLANSLAFASSADYAGARVVIINTKTGKGVVAYAADWGPNTKTAVPSGDSAANAAAWQNGKYTQSGFKSGYSIVDPSGSLARIGGGPGVADEKNHPDVTGNIGQAIGIDSDGEIYMAYDVDQNAVPGTIINCTGALQLSGAQQGTVAPGAHVIQTLTPVAMANETDCGITSTLMITLYYTPTLQSSYLEKTGAGTYRSSPKSAPPLMDFLNSNTGHSDWVTLDEGSRSSSQMITDIKASIDGGDPVLYYSRAVDSDGNHISVIVGYDSSTFYVDDPRPGGDVLMNTNSFNGKSITYAAATAGMTYNDGSTKALVIRSGYAK